MKRILLPGRLGDWDDHDLDTPALLTSDITRTTFYENQFWVYYSGVSGDNRWQEGLLIEPSMRQCLQMPHEGSPEHENVLYE